MKAARMGYLGATAEGLGELARDAVASVLTLPLRGVVHTDLEVREAGAHAQRGEAAPAHEVSDDLTRQKLFQRLKSN